MVSSFFQGLPILSWFIVHFIAGVTATGTTGKCGHTSLTLSTVKSIQQYRDHPFEHPKRELALSSQNDSTVYKPIRIHLHYDTNSVFNLDKARQDFVTQKLIPDAVKFWENSLAVVPVEGNLFAQRQCHSAWLVQTRVCAEAATEQKCYDINIPPEHLGKLRVCKTCTNFNNCAGDDCTILEGKGVPNTDFVLYVLAEQSEHCNNNVLAYAAACQRDQFDRPTFGIVNMCPDHLKVPTTDHEYSQQFTTAAHELSHALGFSSSMYAYMRDQFGKPRTKRDENGEPPRHKDTVCANGIKSPYFPMPDVSTVRFFKERGTSVAKIVTPNVLRYVRNHFGCPTLNGAEIEGQSGGCLGNHWEERLFETEFMTPIISDFNRLSGLTLAYFEDTGWYRSNHSMAESLHWGTQRGCKFATEKCIDPVTQVSIDASHYCTKEMESGCTADGFGKGVCSLVEDVGENIPHYYRYFQSNRIGGGKFHDFCPIYRLYPRGNCANPANLIHPPGTDLNVRGETYCKNCRCTKSTLHNDLAKQWKKNTVENGGCYAMTCSNNTIKLHVTVSKDKVVEVKCKKKGDLMSVNGFTGTIECPDPYLICNEGECNTECGENSFCSGGTCLCLNGYSLQQGRCVLDCSSRCSGNGECNTVTGVCTCKKGYRGEFCDKRECPDNCSSNGNCNSTNGVCMCFSGWGGASCSQQQERDCANSSQCLNNGTCNTIVGTCLCDSEWTGKDCSKTFTSDDGKEENSKCQVSCGVNAFCHNGVCTCEDTFHPSSNGIGCQTACQLNCSGHGTCEEESCECEAGWTGKSCSTKITTSTNSGDQLHTPIILLVVQNLLLLIFERWHEL